MTFGGKAPGEGQQSKPIMTETNALTNRLLKQLRCFSTFFVRMQAVGYLKSGRMPLQGPNHVSTLTSDFYL